MGLRDKAKGLIEEHKDQIQHAMDKAKQTVDKTGDSINRAVTQRLPNTGTMNPAGGPTTIADDSGVVDSTSEEAEPGPVTPPAS
jgi:hypothetical protein